MLHLNSIHHRIGSFIRYLDYNNNIKNIKYHKLYNPKYKKNIIYINNVSRTKWMHTNINKDEILDYLDRKKIIIKETFDDYIIKKCPFCHPIKDQIDNMYRLYINKKKGIYYCHRCGSKGNWIQFKTNVNQMIHGQESVSSIKSVINDTKINISVQSNDTKNKLFNPISFSLLPKNNTNIQPLDSTKAIELESNLYENDEYKSILYYLTEIRGLHINILRKYAIGSLSQQFYDENTKNYQLIPCISFPWMIRQEDATKMNIHIIDDNNNNKEKDKNIFYVIRLKVRCINNKSNQRLIPKGGAWGFFGWHTIPIEATTLVITEGEFDAMAVNQATGLPAISLPNGCRSLPPSLLPLLDRFKKIYLWMDNDFQGQENIPKFVDKLGTKKCYIVRPTGHIDELLNKDNIHINKINKTIPKDANEALLKGFDLNKIIDNSERLQHDQITTFERLRYDVFQEILHPFKAAGVRSITLPSYNKIVKGLRMGELTVLTGPTGAGKTTLLSQLSLDFSQQGVNTLWGSFEIKNVRLLKKMLIQIGGKENIYSSKTNFDQIANKLELLPLYFLKFFGSTEVDDVLDAMEYAVYVYDVQHILLDNVQFMMSGQGKGYDKFEKQDAAYEKFRKFASSKNVHITLVIHPRKEHDNQLLTLASVFGSAKATQEADNVIILQKHHDKKRLDILKNRFDGTIGSIDLKFDPMFEKLIESNTSYDTIYDDITEEQAIQDVHEVIKMENKKVKDTTLDSINTKLKENVNMNVNMNKNSNDLKESSNIECKKNTINGITKTELEPFASFTKLIAR